MRKQRQADKPLRVMYAAGPGDVVGTHRRWLAGEDDPTEVAVTYSGQFMDTIRKLGGEGWVISHCPRVDRAEGGGIRSENRALKHKSGSPLKYHWGQIAYGLGLIRSARAYRPDLLVVSDGTHWFVLRAFKLMGIAVVPTLHCVLWPKFGRSSATRQWLLGRGATLFRDQAFAILTLSNDITRQVQQLTGGPTRPLVPFLPHYRDQTLRIDPPIRGDAFRLLYAGRVETNKGVFDLLSMMARLDKQGVRVVLDICGGGNALAKLQQAIIDAKLQDKVICHGKLNRPELEARYARCDAVIVPTTADFVEGFNKVVCEAILAERPVIVTTVCPGLEYIASAAIGTEPGDVDAYVQAVTRLANDRAYYDQLREASKSLAAQFRDPRHSWGASLERVLAAFSQGRAPEPSAGVTP